MGGYMKIKSKTTKLILEIITIIILIAIVALSFLADLSFYNISDYFLLRIKNTEDLLFSLFAVQATVTTMSIAIIALVSGIVSDNIFGISITRYVLQLKPRLFKHKRLIIFSLIITFLNYFVVSYNLFNTSIAIFLLSIAISIILVKDIFLVFLGRKEIKRQMETYILENYEKIGIDNFQTSLLENDNIYKTTYLKENLQVVQKIFEKESNSSSVDNKSELLTEIETIISDAFIRIYQKNNSEALIMILNYISELYEIANSKEEPVPLAIWDNISREYFKSLSLLSEEQLYNSTFFLRLHSQLYKNLKIKKSDKRNIAVNCYDFKYYNVWIYYSLIVNNKKISNQYDRKRLLEFLYGNITGLMFYPQKAETDETKKAMLMSAWCIFVKALIDEGEKKILEDEFFKDSHYHVAKNSYQVVFVIACIYLYYVACRESLLSGKDSQKFALNIIKENTDNIENILHHINLADFISVNLKFIMEQMRTWEVIPEDEAKCVIIDTVINDFFVFTALKSHWNNEMIANIIKALIGDSTFLLYTHYFSDNKNFDVLFNQYNSLFFNEENDSSSQQYSELLKDVLNVKYKHEEIESGKKNVITDDTRTQFENNIRDTFETILNENSYLFEEKIQNDIEYVEKRICLSELNLPSSIINNSKLDKYISSFIHTAIINAYIYAIRPALSINKKNINDRTLQETLIASIKNMCISGDTFIGNRDVFWGEQDKHLLDKFTKDMKHVKYPDGYNNFYIINHSLVHCVISDFEIEFNDLSQKEIEQMCKKTDDGKLEFNVTNDIYIPFEQDELNEHVHRIRKKIRLYATIKSHLKSDKVGAGIHVIFDE